MHRCRTEVAPRKRKEVSNGVESAYFLSCFSPFSEQRREVMFKTSSLASTSRSISVVSLTTP